MLLSLLASPTLAQDPFRTSNPKPIGPKTEAAFKSIFEKGNYKDAKPLLDQAESGEPLADALKAMMAYGESQTAADAPVRTAALEKLRLYAGQTFANAQKLSGQDPLRGNLYMAVGRFLEGGHVISTQGIVGGTPQALTKVQQAFNYLDKAEQVKPDDPELNLVKGYIDLFLSVTVNLPLSSPNDAIRRLEQLAQPRYLADRGLAIGFRDLKQFDRAMQAVDRAIASAPDNPELKYLKAQILVRQGRNKEALPLFQQALQRKEQLPPGTVAQIDNELRRAQQ
jgi:tetratricopeptide (TPR) repeat protein